MTFATRILAAVAALTLLLSGCAGEPSPQVSPIPDQTPVEASEPDPELAAYVVSALEDGGRVTLVVDPVDWLIGDAAEEAAAAEGDTVDNGFYIVNEDAEAQEFQGDGTVPVTTVVDATGEYCEDMECPEVTLSEWVAALNGPGADALLSTPYWLTIDDGALVGMRQQYVP